MSSFSHISVLLNETVDGLNIKPDGIYVDGTTGGGGHSSLVLSKLSKKGMLYCFDRDPDAINACMTRFKDNKSLKTALKALLETIHDRLTETRLYLHANRLKMYYPELKKDILFETTTPNEFKKIMN